PRNLRPELLDLDEAPFEEVRDSLRDVQRVNRYLSGYRVLLHHIRRFFDRHDTGRPFHILDAATGSADQPIAVVRDARERGIPICVTAVDINRKMIRFARHEAREYPEIRFVQCDVLNLPFRDDSFDVVINSLALHHFSRDHAVAMLRGFSRLGKRGVIINDLHRSRVAHAAIFILTRLLTRNRLTRYDAPVSVMNAFTPDEMREMAEEAGWQRFEVHRHFPYRIALVENKLS
ncbi:MAG: methyltransferase domain-containing protein, partial [Nitrospinaceae bacterium]|nr:methyltransferase domain-containing protein [Nitrospinaceae bacterium]NIR53756.1 methyltransferase domain-containing protein [Nitrospinaceae bacterium]NIS84168.1 methyltransferase domain-containing protein [Nitrospinaceae bacterium]NIT80971.1 methyltransferase domain-containing protein [Nitrospinaceae bacterium]NIU43264.1 methyltransferase domain-containing protein [Nitrospinaceae bacterium]